MVWDKYDDKDLGFSVFGSRAQGRGFGIKDLRFSLKSLRFRA